MMNSTMPSRHLFGNRLFGAGRPAPRLGQDGGVSWQEVRDAISDVIELLPSKYTAGYKSRLDSCLAQVGAGGVQFFAGVICLNQLYGEVKNVLESEKSKPSPKLPGETTVTKSEIPWVPIGIAAAGGVILALALA